MITSYPASSSKIIVSLKTLRNIIENPKKKSERKERSFRENRKKEIIFRSNATGLNPNDHCCMFSLLIGSFIKYVYIFKSFEEA